MILELSLFQIFFMALSIVGLSFSILYLFVGGYNYDSSQDLYADRSQDRKDAHKTREHAKADRENVFDISSGKRRDASVKPPPIQRTSVGRQTARAAQPSMRVLEVDYKVIHNRTTWDEVTVNTLDTLSQITNKVASGTGRW